MMTTEIIEALLEGKKVRKTNWEKYYYIEIKKGNDYVSTQRNDWYNFNKKALLSNWEIVKERVPYYPVLVRIRGLSSPHVKYESFKNLKDAEEYWTPKNLEVIRLITEIPELIEWREE